jgi:hypothetical protein
VAELPAGAHRNAAHSSAEYVGGAILEMLVAHDPLPLGGHRIGPLQRLHAAVVLVELRVLGDHARFELTIERLGLTQ